MLPEKCPTTPIGFLTKLLAWQDRRSECTPLNLKATIPMVSVDVSLHLLAAALGDIRQQFFMQYALIFVLRAS